MSQSLYLRPLDLTPARLSPAEARPLAGGPLRFGRCEVIGRRESGGISRQGVALKDIDPRLTERLERLAAPRADFAGLSMNEPRVMGVVNVTPDSFSDGGDRFDWGRAAAAGLVMAESGAALVDVGGESTRPGADPVPLEEELRRVVPVVRALADQGVAVSIDSRRARVLGEALAAGARVINDVTALSGDPESLALAARSDAAVVLMHMLGEPRGMQRDPRYDDPALDIHDYLAARLAACEAAGIARGRIALDCGIGFGKTVAHNLEILESQALFHGLGCPLVLGVSRKSFIGKLSRGEAPKARVAGSLAGALAGLARGVQIFRVHDVAETLQAIAVWTAISAATGSVDIPTPARGSVDVPTPASVT